MTVLSYIIVLFFAGFAGVAGVTRLIRNESRRAGEALDPRCPKPYRFLLWLSFILGILAWLALKFWLLKFESPDALDFLAGMAGAYLFPHFVVAAILCPDPFRKR